VGAAFGWGALAASSLLIGGLIALRVEVGNWALGLIMAFGSGVLISAVAYELVGEAAKTSEGPGSITLGLFAGALTFFVGDHFLDRIGAESRKRSAGSQSENSGPAIVLGIVLDGIPESVVIGVSVLTGAGVSVAVLAAVFLSNLPEAMAATTGLARSGWPRNQILGLWVLVALASAIAALSGYVLLDGGSASLLAFVLAFAGGAILTMLADTMMPEAFEHAGPLVGLMTTLGFAMAFALSTLE
jgi:ZIP family zinc transporter